MTTQEHRPLRPVERRVLDLILGVDFPGAEALRVQAPTAVVVGHCGCGCPSIELEVASDVPGAKGLNGRVLPVEGRVDRAGQELTDSIIILTDDGRLSYLEYVWHGDKPPAAWPPLAEIGLAP